MLIEYLTSVFVIFRTSLHWGLFTSSNSDGISPRIRACDKTFSIIPDSSNWAMRSVLDQGLASSREVCSKDDGVLFVAFEMSRAGVIPDSRKTYLKPGVRASRDTERKWKWTILFAKLIATQHGARSP